MFLRDYMYGDIFIFKWEIEGVCWWRIVIYWIGTVVKRIETVFDFKSGLKFHFIIYYYLLYLLYFIITYYYLSYVIIGLLSVCVAAL